MRKSVGVLVVVSALAALGLTPSQAAAQTCSFQGRAGNFSPGIPDIFEEDLSEDVETGSYSMVGDVVCADAPSGSFSATGSYESTLCGSGTWRGTWFGSPGSFTYRMEFTNRVGLMYIPDSAPTPSGYVRITPGDYPADTDNCMVDNNDGDNLPGGVGTTNTFGVAGAFGPTNLDDVLPDEVVPPGSGEPSAQCVPPTVDVIDTPVAGGHLRLQMKQNGTSAIWVCVKVAAAGASVGGKLVIVAPGLGGGGTPSVDSSSELCGTTPNNQAPGPHPILGPGTVGGQHVMLNTWSSGAAETWICAEVGTTKTRVKIAIPGVSGGSVSFEPDA